MAHEFESGFFAKEAAMTLKERLYKLQDNGHYLDVSPIKMHGRFLLCRVADGKGGRVIKVSGKTLNAWEEEAEIFDRKGIKND